MFLCMKSTYFECDFSVDRYSTRSTYSTKPQMTTKNNEEHVPMSVGFLRKSENPEVSSCPVVGDLPMEFGRRAHHPRQLDHRLLETTLDAPKNSQVKSSAGQECRNIVTPRSRPAAELDSLIC